MRLLGEFAAAIRRSMERAGSKCDPTGAAESLEAAIGNAVDFDGATLLALSPDSIAGILQVSGADPRVTEYVARSLQLAARYHDEAGSREKAALREAQARAIAQAFGHKLPEASVALEGMDPFLEKAEGL